MLLPPAPAPAPAHAPASGLLPFAFFRLLSPVFCFLYSVFCILYSALKRLREPEMQLRPIHSIDCRNTVEVAAGPALRN